MCKACWLASKHHHWRSRHPDKPRDAVCIPKPQIVELSSSIPHSQRAWTCPVPGCGMGLGTLPNPDRLRAIAKHIAEKHPGETPSSVEYMRRKGRSNFGVSKVMSKKFEKKRNKRHKTHDIVKVVPAERRAKGFRGYMYICRKCLTTVGDTSKPDQQLTCKQRQKRLKENKICHTTRRGWWRRIRANEPLLAKNISEALDRTFEDLDAEFGHDVDTWSARKYREKQAAKKAANSRA